MTRELDIVGVQMRGLSSPFLRIGIFEHDGHSGAKYKVGDKVTLGTVQLSFNGAPIGMQNVVEVTHTHDADTQYERNGVPVKVTFKTDKVEAAQ